MRLNRQKKFCGKNFNETYIKGKYHNTMNVEDPLKCGYSSLFEQNQRMCEAYLGKTQTIWAADTCQFDDYSKYDSRSDGLGFSAIIKYCFV